MTFQQGFGVWRQQAEAVYEFLVHGIEFGAGFAVGEPLVNHQPLVDIVAVTIRQARRRVQIDFGGDAQWCGQIGFQALFERFHRGIQHRAIKVETDFLHFARLRIA